MEPERQEFKSKSGRIGVVLFRVRITDKHYQELVELQLNGSLEEFHEVMYRQVWRSVARRVHDSRSNKS